MLTDFSPSRFFENVSYLIRRQKKKVGEVESEVGVSPGYIARMSKENSGKPGIDVAVKFADVLGVSVDSLLTAQYGSLTPTELYIVDLLEKLRKDTQADKLDWKMETPDQLEHVATDFEPNEGVYVYHNLLTYETFSEFPMDGEAPEQVSRVTFVSRAFGPRTGFNGPCYNLRIKNGSIIYLMDLCKSIYHASDKDAFAQEIWMYTPKVGKQYLCGNKDNASFEVLVECLFEAVTENAKHPKINKTLKYALDAFMEDDFEDDPEPEQEPELPF